MKLKTAVKRILVIYFSTALLSIFTGWYTDYDFFTTLGLFVALVGLGYATSLQVKHVIYNLKKNNLWDDTIPQKAKPVEDKQDG